MLMVCVVQAQDPVALTSTNTIASSLVAALSDSTDGEPLIVSASSGPSAAFSSGELAQYEARVAELKALYKQARKEGAMGGMVLR